MPKDGGITEEPTSWPRGTTLMSHIVFSSALDEVSNAPDVHFVRHITKDAESSAAAIFTLYQTTRHGPQNGWRLISITKGANREKVDSAIRATGGIYQDTAEMYIFDEAGNSRFIADSSEDQTRRGVVKAVISSGAVTRVTDSSISTHIRKTACYPLSVRSTSTVSQDPTTGRGGILIAESGDEQPILVVFEDGASPEAVQEQVKSFRAGRGNGSNRAIVFEGLHRSEPRVVEFA